MGSQNGFEQLHGMSFSQKNFWWTNLGWDLCPPAIWFGPTPKSANRRLSQETAPSIERNLARPLGADVFVTGPLAGARSWLPGAPGEKEPKPRERSKETLEIPDSFFQVVGDIGTCAEWFPLFVSKMGGTNRFPIISQLDMPPFCLLATVPRVVKGHFLRLTPPPSLARAPALQRPQSGPHRAGECHGSAVQHPGEIL